MSNRDKWEQVWVVYVILFNRCRIISKVLKWKRMDGSKEEWSHNELLEFAQTATVCWQSEEGEMPDSELNHFLHALVPRIDRLAGIKESMNRGLGVTVIHMDHTELLSSDSPIMIRSHCCLTDG